MKFIILMIAPVIGLSQAKDCNKTLVGIGITAGYSVTKHTPVGEGYIAIKPANSHVIITPMSIKVHGDMSNPTMPVIFEPRIAYKVKAFEFYGGISANLAGQDGKKEYKQYQGIYPAIGIISHPFKKIIVTAGLSRFDKNKVFTVQLGIFDFK